MIKRPYALNVRQLQMLMSGLEENNDFRAYANKTGIINIFDNARKVLRSDAFEKSTNNECIAKTYSILIRIDQIVNTEHGEQHLNVSEDYNKAVNDLKETIQYMKNEHSEILCTLDV